MKKTNDDFLQFQKYFKEYQQRFGLMGYQVYFKYESLEHSFASIIVNQFDKVVTVRLNSKPDKETEPFKDIKKSAKHEALHLLIYNMEDLARVRYIQEWTVNEASEELVHKLEGLIEEVK